MSLHSLVALLHTIVEMFLFCSQNIGTVLNSMARGAVIVLINASPSDIIEMKNLQVCRLNIESCPELCILQEQHISRTKTFCFEARNLAYSKG